MKSAQYFFEKLSEKEQKEVKENFEKSGRTKISFEQLMSCKCHSFSQFIHFAFIWSLTSQGYQYWKEISERKVD